MRYYGKANILDKFKNIILLSSLYGFTLLSSERNSFRYYTAVKTITLLWLDKAASVFSVFSWIHSSLSPLVSSCQAL